jgi:hypothetical protein
MNFAGESVRWNPLGQRVGIEERAINPLRWRAEHAVKSNGAGAFCGHIRFVFWFSLV